MGLQPNKPLVSGRGHKTTWIAHISCREHTSLATQCTVEQRLFLLLNLELTGSCAHCHCSTSQRRATLHINSPGKDPNSEFRIYFLLHAHRHRVKMSEVKAFEVGGCLYGETRHVLFFLCTPKNDSLRMASSHQP